MTRYEVGDDNSSNHNNTKSNDSNMTKILEMGIMMIMRIMILMTIRTVIIRSSLPQGLFGRSLWGQRKSEPKPQNRSSISR